jgi:L-arabinose isomerase
VEGSSGRVEENGEESCEGQRHAGGAHHASFSQAVTPEQLEDYAEMAGIELVLIDADTRLRELKKELLWNETAYVAAPRLP